MQKPPDKRGVMEDRLAGIVQAISYAKENNIKLIIHSGDVFNETRPTLDNIYNLNKILVDAEKLGISFLIIAGNHDQPRIKGAFSVPEFFNLVKGMYVFTEPQIFEYEGAVCEL